MECLELESTLQLRQVSLQSNCRFESDLEVWLGHPFDHAYTDVLAAANPASQKFLVLAVVVALAMGIRLPCDVRQTTPID